jgi:hypothetical protein
MVCLAMANFCLADVSISSLGVTTTIDFDSTLAGSNNGAFTGAGFAPSPGAGQLDSNSWSVSGLSDGSLAFGGTGTTGDFARGPASAGVGTGGVYGFDIDNDDSAAVNRALGIQPGSSDFTPGSFTLRVANDTGVSVNQWNLRYDIYFKNNEDRANSFNFSFSTDGSSFTSVGTLDFTSPEARDAQPRLWQATPRATSLAASVAAGGQLYLRWTGEDVSGSGSRDEFAVDNIAITAVPEPSAFLFGGLLCSVLGARAAVKWRRGRRTA